MRLSVTARCILPRLRPPVFRLIGDLPIPDFAKVRGARRRAAADVSLARSLYRPFSPSTSGPPRPPFSAPRFTCRISSSAASPRPVRHRESSPSFSCAPVCATCPLGRPPTPAARCAAHTPAPAPPPATTLPSFPAVSKTAAAPIERIKLLIQNQVRARGRPVGCAPGGLLFFLAGRSVPGGAGGVRASLRARRLRALHPITPVMEMRPLFQGLCARYCVAAGVFQPHPSLPTHILPWERNPLPPPWFPVVRLFPILCRRLKSRPPLPLPPPSPPAG